MRDNYPDKFLLHGWFYINGQLKGELPLQTVIKLVPNEYDLLCVTFQERHSQCYFTSFSTRIQIDAGKETVCPFNEWKNGQSVLDVKETVSPVADNQKYTIPEKSITEVKDVLEQFKEQPRIFEEFVNSNVAYRAFTAAAANSQGKRYMLVELPESMGGVAKWMPSRSATWGDGFYTR